MDVEATHQGARGGDSILHRRQGLAAPEYRLALHDQSQEDARPACRSERAQDAHILVLQLT